jgi:hypothetical protein
MARTRYQTRYRNSRYYNRDASNSLWEAFIGLSFLVLLAILVAHPLGWLWNAVVIDLFNFLNPITSDFWVQVATFLGVFAVLKFLGAFGDRYFNYTPGSAFYLIATALPIWGVFVVVWLILELVE